MMTYWGSVIRGSRSGESADCQVVRGLVVAAVIMARRGGVLDELQRRDCIALLRQDFARKLTGTNAPCR